MSDLSRLPGIEDCLSNVLSYCTIEDMLTCHKLSSSWKVTLESHSLKKCWASRLKKSVQDNEMILKSSSNQIIYQINVQSNVDGVATVEQRSVDDFSFFTDSREDWNRICYKFIQDGSIEDIIQFSTLLVASLRRVERPMNRYGPIEWMDPLHIAVLESDTMAVKFLLPFINIFGKYQGKTAFILACEQKEVEIIKLFLEIIEDRKRRCIFHDVDHEGKSGFMWLCYHGLNDLIRDITFPTNNTSHNQCGNGLPIDDPRDLDGSTPLMTATMKKHHSTVELLMQKGANINAKDKSGKTAFTLAIWLADIDMVKLYFQYAREKSIDFNSTDDTGRTAYIYACMLKLEEIANILREKAEEFGIDLMKKDIDGLMGSDFIEIRENQDEFDFPVELGSAEEWNRLTKNERRLRLYNRELRSTQDRDPYFMPSRGPGDYQIDEDMPVQLYGDVRELREGFFVRLQPEAEPGDEPNQMEQDD